MVFKKQEVIDKLVIAHLGETGTWLEPQEIYTSLEDQCYAHIRYKVSTRTPQVNKLIDHSLVMWTKAGAAVMERRPKKVVAFGEFPEAVPQYCIFIP